MSKSHRCLITYVGLALLVGCWLMGCSSGASDEGSGSSNVTAAAVLPPGTLGPLADIGDLIGDGENWYETRVMCLGENDTVGGQTTVNLGPVKGAFLWDGAGMTYLGIHGESGTPLDPWDLYNTFESGDPKPFIYSEAVAIGPNGDVVCNSTTGTNWPDETEKRAFYWNAGVQTDLPPVQVQAPDSTTGQFSEAFDINATHVVFNREEEKGQDIYAVRWPIGVNAPLGPGVPWIPHPTIPGALYDYTFGLTQILGAGVVEPVDVNNNNEVITNSIDLTVVFHDFINGGSADLGALSQISGLSEAGDATVGAAINDYPGTGHVAGTTGDMAFFWEAGTMHALGHLGGGTSEAMDINNSDFVIGNSTTASGSTHAFLWTPGGGMIDLGTLGGANSWAVDINDNGLIVGNSETGATYTTGGITYNVVHAFAWYNNVIYDLGIHSNFYSYNLANPFPFSEAIAVNNNNRIAGNSYSPNAHYRGFILDAVIP